MFLYFRFQENEVMIQPAYRTVFAAAAVAALCLARAHPAQAAACADLAGLAIPHATVTSATEITGGVFKDDTRVADGEVKSYRDLPAFCRVRGVSRPTRDSEI